MIPSQLLYILVGALFSAISTLCLTTYREYKQSVRTRRVIFTEMESMKGLLETMSREDKDERPTRVHIHRQLSTKMYDQHLPNLGRLTDKEITAVMSFYQRVTYILESHQTYNEIRQSDTPDDDEKRRKQLQMKWFSSYSIQPTVKRALLDLRAAEAARNEMGFLEYILSRISV